MSTQSSTASYLTTNNEFRVKRRNPIIIWHGRLDHFYHDNLKKKKKIFIRAQYQNSKKKKMFRLSNLIIKKKTPKKTSIILEILTL